MKRSLYFAVYRVRTGLIERWGRCQKPGKLVAPRGRAVAYSRSPINPDLHTIRGGLVQQKPVGPDARYRAEGDVAIIEAPDGATIQRPFPRGGAVKMGTRPQRVKFRHPERRIMPLTIPPVGGSA